jgi:hypothetical protein
MAAGNTYEAIATQTLGSAAASVTFSSIPGTYTDLVVVIAGTLTTGSDNVSFQLNGDSGANYSVTVLTGDGSTASSGRASNLTDGGRMPLDATQGVCTYLSSVEEAEELLARIPTLIGKSWTPVTSNGQPDSPRPLSEKDILIVTR